MARTVKPLTNTEVKNAKPLGKPYKLFDGGGLFLLVKPNGSKWWRLKYLIDGKEKLLSMGVYDDVSLQSARERRDEARKLLAAGVDPGENRKAVKLARAEKNANTFEVIAREWAQKQSKVWTPRNKIKITNWLEKDLFPWLGNRPITEISAVDLKRALERIESRGAQHIAHRILQTCGQIFRYAVASGRVTHNPCPDLKGSLAPIRKNHYAAITEPKLLGDFLFVIRGYQGEYSTRMALRLLPLLLLRPGELRYLEWSEVDFEAAQINIPAHRMKIKDNGAHVVPLSRQATEILRELKPLTGRGRFLFPCSRTTLRPISDNTLNAAMRRIGFPKEVVTAHGFRATARTILDETLGIRPDFIEHQLAHSVRDPNGRAYNRTAHLAERKKMMQTWADYLESLSQSTKSAA